MQLNEPNDALQSSTPYGLPLCLHRANPLIHQSTNPLIHQSLRVSVSCDPCAFSRQSTLLPPFSPVQNPCASVSICGRIPAPSSPFIRLNPTPILTLINT